MLKHNDIVYITSDKIESYGIVKQKLSENLYFCFVRDRVEAFLIPETMMRLIEEGNFEDLRKILKRNLLATGELFE